MLYIEKVSFCMKHYKVKCIVHTFDFEVTVCNLYLIIYTNKYTYIHIYIYKYTYQHYSFDICNTENTQIVWYHISM